MTNEMEIIESEDVGGKQGVNILQDALGFKVEHGGYLRFKEKRVRCLQCKRAIRNGKLSLFGYDTVCDSMLCIAEYIAENDIKFKDTKREAV